MAKQGFSANASGLIIPVRFYDKKRQGTQYWNDNDQKCPESLILPDQTSTAQIVQREQAEQGPNDNECQLYDQVAPVYA